MIITPDIDYKPTIPCGIISVSSFSHPQGLPPLVYSSKRVEPAAILRASRENKQGFRYSATQLQEDANRYLESSRWGQACREMFYELVIEDAEILAGLIRSQALKPSSLTFAAETLGQAPLQENFLVLLLDLLKHTSPIVREGAIYGLTNYLSDNRVQVQLRHMADHDVNEEVCEAAREALGE